MSASIQSVPDREPEPGDQGLGLRIVKQDRSYSKIAVSIDGKVVSTERIRLDSAADRRECAERISADRPEWQAKYLEGRLVDLAADACEASLDGLDDLDGDSQKVSPADEVLAFLEASWELHRSDSYGTFLVPKDGGKIVLPIELGERLLPRISAGFRDLHGYIVSGQAIKDAIQVLVGRSFELPTTQLSLRVSRNNSTLFHDLGTRDGSVVVIEPGGWRVENEVDPVFFRTRLTGPLDLPLTGGSFDDLWSIANVCEADRPLIMAWLVAALVPDMVHPVLMVLGRSGTGKTTLGQRLKGLIDPSSAMLAGPPRKEDDWAATAVNQWIVGIDNVSSIQPWWSDALCRACTDEGVTKRTLYSNGDVSVLQFRRTILLTSIDIEAIRGDLAQRSLVLELAPLPAGYASEMELQRRFKQLRGRIQAAIYDLASEVLLRKGEVRLEKPGRLVDFERILATVDLIEGTKGLDRYRGTAARVAVEVIQSSAVAMAIVDLLVGVDTWKGTFDELRRAAEPHPRPRDWPTTAKGMGSAVRRVADELASVGVGVVLPTDENRGGTRERLRLLELWIDDRVRVEELRGGSAGGGDSSSSTEVSRGQPSKPSEPSNDPAQEPQDQGFMDHLVESVGDEAALGTAGDEEGDQ